MSLQGVYTAAIISDFFYMASAGDKQGGKSIPGKSIAMAASNHFGNALIRHDHMPPRISAPNFPVRQYDGAIESSLKLSPMLDKLPSVEVDTVYCDKSILSDAIKCKQENAPKLLGLI